MSYRTKQRDEILRFFMDHEDECYTAREVCRQVNAGDATVFRTLGTLTEEGLLKRFTATGHQESAAYQYNACGTHCDHIHLKCSRCGILLHMDCTFMKEIEEHFRREHGFLLDCGQTVIYGLCESCAADGKEEKA